MAQTKRAQILMDPDEYQVLEEIARRRKTSIAELFRVAVRTLYISSTEDRRKAVTAIAGMGLSLPSWEDLKQELSEVHDGGIH